MNLKKRTAAALIALLMIIMCLPLLVIAENETNEVFLTIPDPDGGIVDVSRPYKSISYSDGIAVYTFEKGAEITLTFTPEEGGSLISAYLNEFNCNFYNNKYTFNIEEDFTLYAYFQKAQLSKINISLAFEGNPPEEDITVSINSKTVSGGKAECIKNSTPELSVITPEGYVAERAVITFADKTQKTIYFSKNKAILPAVASDINVEIIVIEGGGINVTIQAGSGGKAEANKYYPKQGENVTFTFIPDEGFELDKVTLNGTQITVTNNQYTARAVSDLAIVATFKTKITKKTVTIEVDPDGAFGTAAFKNDPGITTLTVEHGANITIVFTPQVGYEINDVKANGVSQNTSNNELVLSITQNLTVSVKFKIKDIKITALVTAAGGGDIIAEGIQIVNNMISVEYGGSVTFVFTPHLGYVISGVRVNNQLVTVSNNKYTFKDVTEPQTISVTYKLEGSDVLYTVTATAEAGGTISPGGVQKIQQGESITFTITANEGFEILAVEYDGVDVSLTGGKFTINDIAADHTIKAIFKESGSANIKESITTSDVDWSGSEITIDLSQTTVVSKAVFDKINNDCKTKTVTFRHGDFELILPVGCTVVVAANTVDLKISKNNSPNNNLIDLAVKTLDPTASFSIINLNSIIPVESNVRVFLGLAFANRLVDYYKYENNSLVLAEKGIAADSSGYVTTKYESAGDMVFVVKGSDSSVHTLTVKVGENGTVSPNGEKTVSHGEYIDFEIYANEGYYISEVIVNGENITLNDTKQSAASYRLQILEDSEIEFKFMLLDEKSNIGLIFTIVILSIGLVGGSVFFAIKWKQTKY